MIRCSLLLVLLFSPLIVPADQTDDAKDQSNRVSRELRMIQLDLACQDPYRKVGDRLYDLTPRFDYEREMLRFGASKTFTNVPLPEWEFVSGDIIQAEDGDIVIYKDRNSHKEHAEKAELIFVRHYKHRILHLPDTSGDLFVTFLTKCSYTNIAGEVKTIDVYDCGKILHYDEMEAETLKMQAKQRLENYQRDLVVQKALNELDKAKKEEFGEIATIKFLKEKAAEGMPMAQYRLAKKYLDGDHLPLDVKQAEFWLQCSCTNGYAEASNLLEIV